MTLNKLFSLEKKMNSSNKSYLNYDKNSLNELPCDNILFFQVRPLSLTFSSNLMFYLEIKQKLQKFRQLDDKIINILNCSIKTESFYSKQDDPSRNCIELNNEVQEYYKLRENAIKKCVSFTKDEIVNLKQVDESNKFLLREKIFNLRQYEDELKVEDVIKSRSLKVIEIEIFNLKIIYFFF
jgi:hypothetical protein